MQTDPYQIVSRIYDHIMQRLSYQDWANYVSELKTIYHNDAKIYLEIACGTGKLQRYLEKIFEDITLLDISKSMLIRISPKLKRVCADMTRLPFNTEFDFIYSTFDSINYITDEEEVQKYFSGVREILAEDGIFTFDASLENNSVKNAKRLNREGRFRNLEYKQNSIYDKNSKLHTNSFRLELENGEIIDEVHTQKIYDFDYYFHIAEITGLTVIDCFEAFTFEDASSENERVQFIMKKM